MSTTTSSPPADPLPPQRPLERFAHMETDVFCEGCGYNLHGQPVHRDERLGLMVCRCPECGRFHAAGHGTAATSVWMSRLAAGLLLLWILLVLGVATLAVVGFGVLQAFPVDTMTTGTWSTRDGKEIENKVGPNGTYAWYFAGTMEPVAHQDVFYLRFVRPNMLPTTSAVLMFNSIYGSVNAGIGFASGMLLVTFLWHWPRRRYYIAVLVPLIIAMFLVVSYWLDLTYSSIQGWTMSQFARWAIVQSLFVAIGIRIGRPLARLLLRMFVPPKPRHHFAFLWQIDGKTPPPATFES